VYTGQTGHLIETKNITDTSICTILRTYVVAEHSINLGYQIQLQSTIILAKNVRQMDQILWEAVKIELLLDNINRENGFSLSQASMLLTYDLKE
jgi:hypothetical protein